VLGLVFFCFVCVVCGDFFLFGVFLGCFFVVVSLGWLVVCVFGLLFDYKFLWLGLCCGFLFFFFFCFFCARAFVSFCCFCFWG